jgi:type IV pilus assembly protein PilW
MTSDRIAASSPRARSARRQSGFTLIELMISLTIGLFIVIALLTLLISVNRSNGELTKTNRLIENGRFALQLLEADVSHAGYWGGFVPQFDDLSYTATPTYVATGVPDPCPAAWSGGTTTTFATPTYVTNLLAIPLQAYEIPDPVPAPTLSVCANRVVNPQANTDVLFVRHLDPAGGCIPGAGCPAAAGMPYFQMNRCGNSSSPGYSTTTYIFGTTTAAFTLRQRNCTSSPPAAVASTGTLSTITAYVSSLYYIRNYADTVGDGIPTLVRSQFGLVGGVPQYQPEQAFVPGIDGFRVELGVDSVNAAGTTLTMADFQSLIHFPVMTVLSNPTNRADGHPDGAYVHCTTAAPCSEFQFMNTVAVRIYVLARGDSPSPSYVDTKTYQMGSTTMGPFNDRYKRHLFVQTIRLTNVSGRRES